MNLKKSPIRASEGYQFYEIPNASPDFMFAFYKNEEIDIVGRDERDIWFRLGDREDLKPSCLQESRFGLCSYRGTDKASRESFIKKTIQAFSQTFKDQELS